MLTFQPSPGSAKDMTYDNNGNLLTVTNNCGTTTYTWDVRNRLTGISGYKSDCSTLSASFGYDAIGRRIQKTINGTTTQYVYDSLDVIQEKQGGSVSANYIRTLNIDEPLTRIKGSTVRHYVLDALGSVIALTDDSGVVKTTYTYDPFGNVTVSGESSDNPFQYTGRKNDGTGLYYYRARYYSPELQRFISEDPIKDGINYYEFIKNNPVKYTDPFGEEVRLCQRAKDGLPIRLGPVHHSYLNVNGVIYGFHPEKDRPFGKGLVRVEEPGRDIKCGPPLKCVDDSCVLQKITVTSASPPNYSWGFYDCRAWAEMIILLCKKKDCCE